MNKHYNFCPPHSCPHLQLPTMLGRLETITSLELLLAVHPAVRTSLGDKTLAMQGKNYSRWFSMEIQKTLPPSVIHSVRDSPKAKLMGPRLLHVFLQFMHCTMGPAMQWVKPSICGPFPKVPPGRLPFPNMAATISPTPHALLTM